MVMLVTIAATIFCKDDSARQVLWFCKTTQSIWSELRQHHRVHLVARKIQSLKALQFDIQRAGYDIFRAFGRKTVNLAVFQLNCKICNLICVKNSVLVYLWSDNHFYRTKRFMVTPVKDHFGTKPVQARQDVNAYYGSCPLGIELRAFTMRSAISV